MEFCLVISRVLFIITLKQKLTVSVITIAILRQESTASWPK